ncbi:hypothetical protein PT279_05180 [Bifidobacterium sp. ESL0784]|uniref:hypothetical protein n=1 Tax=Bifidobacterium sp. ESL0784 TaxID=2983231 RepID=UPI0023F69A68|nr:hypothetical protein [Bifidobacterium sp. ESL0784]MDF7640981.1 hypothetical protein [Bifidobacterium sp. ESL0784]
MNNLSVFIGILPGSLVVLRSFIVEGLGGGRDFRRIKRHAELRSKLSTGTKAAENMDSLLEIEIKKYKERISHKIRRRINKTNFILIFIIAIGGGGISYLLFIQAQKFTGIFSVILWILFWVFTGFIVLLITVGGLPQLFDYEEKTDSK